jgi:endonuclease/exonuclease/phosphatase family metal-dependent hydrolase
MKIGLWLLVVPGLIWAVLRLFGGERGFLVQAFAFTPYVAAWTLIPAIIALAMKRWPALGAAVAAVVIMIWCVLPRALPDHDTGPSAGDDLTVMTINMFIGAADPAAIVELVRDHDVAVLAVQEFSPTARRGLGNAGLDALLPYSALADEVGTTGSGLYSRFPITTSHSERSGGGNMQVFATVQPPGTSPLDVVSAHPLAPYSTKVLSLWKGDLDAEPKADILMGDFNSTLDHTPVRRLIARGGYRDAADATGKGLLGTWGPYHGKPVPPVTLDHVLAAKRLGIKDVQVHGVKGSDHRSVIATLVVAGGR